MDAHPVEAHLYHRSDRVCPGRCPAEILADSSQWAEGVIRIAGSDISLLVHQGDHIPMAIVDLAVTWGVVGVVAYLDAHQHAHSVIGEGGERRLALVSLIREMAQYIDIINAVAQPLPTSLPSGVLLPHHCPWVLAHNGHKIDGRQPPRLNCLLPGARHLPEHNVARRRYEEAVNGISTWTAD